MQYDMARFDQPLVDETQPKAHVWTDIGEAEVEHNIFGNAKVRVYRKRDEVRGALGWAIFTLALVAGAVWLVHDYARQPEIVYVAPVAPVAEKAAPAPTPAVPMLKPRVVPQPVVQSSTVSTAPVAKPLTYPAAPLTAASAPAAAKPSPVIVKPVPLPANEKLLAPVAPVPATPAAPAPALQAKPAMPQSSVSATQ